MNWVTALLQIILKLLQLLVPSILKSSARRKELEKSFEEHLAKTQQDADKAASIDDDMKEQLEELRNGHKSDQ